jgi:hypothetical protein
MTDLQYRIGTVSFLEEAKPTWGTRSGQILDAMSRWGREGWTISRLNTSMCLRLQARGFCLLLERPLSSVSRQSLQSRRLPDRSSAA